MSYTFTEHTAVAGQVTYTFRFAGRDKGYLRASDIIVEKFENSTWVSMEGWQLTNTNQITFAQAPTAGLKFRIRRVVEKDYPYAEFDRGVALDMKSLNGSFIHILEITQEILDGFYPEGYFVKQDVNWGGHKITNLGDGTNPKDAVNKGQLDALDKKHTDWNSQQDLEIAGIKAGLVSNVAHRTLPWYYTAKGGEIEIHPPYEFQDCIIFINGVFQHELAGAFAIRQNTIELAEPLSAGDELYALIGSRFTPPVESDTYSQHHQVEEGTVKLDIRTSFKALDVYLDGLYQGNTSYTTEGSVITFSEPLPACMVSIKIKHT
jgi:hypothetical protein|nr:MAG TPA: tail fiber protein [Caudoviricetes sp.]